MSPQKLQPMMKTLIILVAAIFAAILIVAPVISFSNAEIKLANSYKQKDNERKAFYDKMYKTIAQQTQLSVKNDESFQSVVNAQVQGQKTAENTMMVWIQQSNPAATFTEVTRLYELLARTIDAERKGFFEQEKMLQDIDMQHNNLLQQFPNSFINFFVGRKEFDYKPLSSDQTDAVFETKVDNNIDLKL